MTFAELNAHPPATVSRRLTTTPSPRSGSRGTWHTTSTMTAPMERMELRALRRSRATASTGFDPSSIESPSIRPPSIGPSSIGSSSITGIRPSPSRQANRCIQYSARRHSRSIAKAALLDDAAAQHEIEMPSNRYELSYAKTPSNWRSRQVSVSAAAAKSSLDRRLRRSQILKQLAAAKKGRKPSDLMPILYRSSP